MKVIISASHGKSLINFRGDLIRKMVERGHEVICTSIEPESDMKTSIHQLGASYYRLKGTRTAINFLEGLQMILQYIRLYHRQKPDISFLYMSKPIAYGGIAAILCGVKHLFVFVTGLEIAFYEKGIKHYFIRMILKFSYKIVHSHCDKVFFMNQDDYNKMLKWKLVKEDQAVFVNGSGVNMEYFVKKDMPKVDRICMTARLLKSKGIYEYNEAAKIVHLKYPQIEFILVGALDENTDAISKEDLQLLIEQGEIIYKGYADDVRPYLKECTIFVLPTYHEGNGKSIVEAEAVGRPIITTEAPGARETVIDGYNGFLIPIKDAQALAEKIILLLNYPELKEQMAEHSYLLCKEKFDVNKINEIFIDKLEL